MAKAEILDAMASLGLTVESVFVPFSQSRNAGEKSPSLNWRVTLKRNGREILTTDYMAGMAHCPSYGKPVPSAWNRPDRDWQPMVCAWECEHGFRAGFYSWRGGFSSKSSKAEEAILPDAANVVWALSRDADVLDYPTYESWASECGYDPDSRKGEAIYRTCLEDALKLRAGIGDAGLELLRKAGEDY